MSNKILKKNRRRKAKKRKHNIVKNKITKAEKFPVKPMRVRVPTYDAY